MPPVQKFDFVTMFLHSDNCSTDWRGRGVDYFNRSYVMPKCSYYQLSNFCDDENSKKGRKTF